MGGSREHVSEGAASIRSVQLLLQRFAEDRDWVQFHTPKNLAMALSAEAGEFLAEFQWLTPSEAEQVMEGPSGERVRDELADVGIYLLRLCDVLGVDLLQEVVAKVNRNEARYPVHLARSSHAKYQVYEGSAAAEHG